MRIIRISDLFIPESLAVEKVIRLHVISESLKVLLTEILDLVGETGASRLTTYAALVHLEGRVRGPDFVALGPIKRDLLSIDE